MSSILKALRKIEEEKRVASHVAPDLRMDQGKSEGKSRPFLPLIAGIALGAVFVGLFSLWYSSDNTEVAKQSPLQSNKVDVASKQAVQPVIGPAEKIAEATKSTPSAATEREPFSEPVVETVKIPEIILPAEPVQTAPVKPVPVKSLKPPVITEKQVKPAEIAKESPDVVANPVKTAKSELQPVKVRALPEGVSLKVSEVFYQEDPANSLAVVNDLPVMIGTFVDSAVVLEIHSGKVVFKIGDDTYDVPVVPHQ